MAGSDVTARQNSWHSYIYLAAWGMVALLAATYLSALIFKPELVERSFGLPLIKQESNQGTRSLSKALAELEALKTNVRKLEDEIVELRLRDVVPSRRAAGGKRAAAMAEPAGHLSATAKPADMPRPAKPRREPQQAASDKSPAPGGLTPKRLSSSGPTTSGPASISSAANEIVARFSDSAEDGRAAVGATPETAAKIATALPPTGIRLINGIDQPGGVGQELSAAKKNLSETRAAKIQAPKTPAVASGALRSSLVDVKQKDTAARRVARKPKAAAPAAVATAKTAVVAPRSRVTAPLVDEFGGPGVLAWPATDRPAASRIATGSIKRHAPIKFGEPVVKRATRPALAVALASGPSVASLRLHWLALTDRFGDELAGLQPRYVASGKGGDKRYRLVAGPLRSGAEALQICSQLSDKNISCSISTLKGRRF